jgi:hypothetical protein
MSAQADANVIANVSDGAFRESRKSPRYGFAPQGRISRRGTDAPRSGGALFHDRKLQRRGSNCLYGINDGLSKSLFPAQASRFHIAPGLL